MDKEIPDYLRLHVEEAAPSPPPQAAETPAVQQLAEAFEQATGWRLRVENQDARPGQWVSDPVGPFAWTLSPSEAVPDGKREPQVEREKAQTLAGAVAALIDELQQTRLGLWCREAELAAGVPVTVRGSGDADLARRLEAVLKGGADAVGAQAAALYLLDDATTQLKMRACWGIPKQRLLQPARPLRGAVADLEALLGHAVVLEETALLPHWRVPESFPAAVCVPLESSTEPLGTLWVFADRVRTFSDQQTNLIEIIAGRIVAELQREALLKECVASKHLDRQLALAAQWQQHRLPNVKPLLDDWRLAAGRSAGEAVGRGFYDWCIAPDSSLAIAVGSADGSLLESALSAASLQTLARAYAQESRNAAELLARVNASLWDASAGGQFGSLMFARLNPESGALECAQAGAVQAFILGPDAARRVPAAALPLGSDPDLRPPCWQGRLAPGEVLLALAAGPTRGEFDMEEPPAYVEHLRRHRDQSAERLLAMLTAALAAGRATPAGDGWTALILKRCAPPSVADPPLLA